MTAGLFSHAALLISIMTSVPAVAKSLDGCWLADVETSVEYNQRTLMEAWTDEKEVRFRKGLPESPARRWLWCFDGTTLTRYLGAEIDTTMRYKVLREDRDAVTLELDSGVKAATTFHFVRDDVVYSEHAKVRTYMTRKTE